MDMSDPRLASMIGACEDGLRQLCNAPRADVYMFAGNGHGGWETTIVNLLAPGQKVLVAGTGHFSEQWAQHAETLGAVVIRTPFVEGHPIDASLVEAVLRADTKHEIVAVFTVHTDTASGVTSDLPAVRAAIDAAGHPALFVVDVVASLAAAPFDMAALRANVAIGASQKALMVPPGLSFVVVDAQAMQVAERNKSPRVYWDWERRKSEFVYRKFCGTPPQNLLMGLEAALALVLTEGVESVWARHSRVAAATQAAVARWSEAGALSFFAKIPATRSVSVTAISVAESVDPDAMRVVARERFQVAVAGGLGPQTGKMFRIGHLGDVNPAMIMGCLGGIEAALMAQGIPFKAGGLEAAIACLGA
jgi:alanine-glyoxylate transaminase/serine-glyoxylate transaminase/serine-pyruvate transaminase